MNSSHNWPRLYSKVGMNRTFLKQTSISNAPCFLGSAFVQDLTPRGVTNSNWWGCTLKSRRVLTPPEGCRKIPVYRDFSTPLYTTICGRINYTRRSSTNAYADEITWVAGRGVGMVSCCRPITQSAPRHDESASTPLSRDPFSHGRVTLMDFDALRRAAAETLRLKPRPRPLYTTTETSNGDWCDSWHLLRSFLQDKKPITKTMLSWDWNDY